ncbi:hypothetical protein [Neptuniibacter pectenicola]|uniref:hypothetical protein n=1 Tax=Neptuniibacter pectenicola TaxID=1806669 RepID=UPI000831BE03|nr:hypothetical protein [Neptuniibacter pectenicola]
MDYRETADIKEIQMKPSTPSRSDMARELRKQDDCLRDEGNTAAEFWLAEQYEKTANLLN